jgi:hypothetical protein
LVIDDSNWPLLTGGCCVQVAVKSGLTVLLFKITTACEWLPLPPNYGKGKLVYKEKEEGIFLFKY